MKVAYLILAHNQPEQLKRLVGKLMHDNAFFYIHVDKKSADVSSIKALFDNNSKIKVISKYSIFWMGFNMVKATIELLFHAARSGHKFKYYVLLSGQDYPIKSNDYIMNFFNEHTSDFISYNSFTDLSPDIQKKTKLFYFLDHSWVNPRSQGRKKWLIWLQYGINKKIGKLLPGRKVYKGMQPYFGSQWFALTDDSIHYILNFITSNKGYRRFMKYTEGPDEFFFQTILLNSDRKKNLYKYESYIKWRESKEADTLYIHEFSSLRYMDWSERGKPKPAILDIDYYKTLVSSKDLFARKFDQDISSALLDKIDSELL